VVGVPVRLDGRQSQGPHGDAIRFRWTLVSTPPQSAARIEHPTSARPTFTPDVPGTYVARLVVGDGTSRSAPSEVSVTAAAPGPWVPHLVGSGEIPDLVTGGTIALPFEHRVHVALVAEGFTAADLARGAFDTEAARWVEEILAIEPYTSFREALVVWTLPLASGARVAFTGPQTEDTALRVPITRDGRGVGLVPPGGPTAARVWQALRQFPVPLSFYGPGGRTGHLARNLVVVVAILDPLTGAAGFSGRAVTAVDPLDPNRRVPLALAFGRAHEFTHAFSRLLDEYLKDDLIGYAVENRRAAESAWLSNVVARPDCGTLPWRHLLPGSEINPDAHSLVGAFGTPGHGYHPELKCLMNGTHDNARYYGGDGHLRTRDRMCNFCREVTTFRILERTGVLPHAPTAFQTWAAHYRGPYYRRFGFFTPEVLPQANSVGRAHYQSCLGNPSKITASPEPPAAARPSRFPAARSPDRPQATQ
jgi:hypothetical protein